jgi:hypothetical protein
MLARVEAEIAAKRKRAVDEIESISKAKIEEMKLTDRQEIIKYAIGEIVNQNGGMVDKTKVNSTPSEWRDILAQRHLIASEYVDGIAEVYEIPLNEAWHLFMSPEMT